MFCYAAASLHMRCLDANNSRPADRACGEMRKMPIVDKSVGRRILAHRRHHDPVAQRDRTKRDRLEQPWFRIPLQDAPCVLERHQKMAFASNASWVTSPWKSGNRWKSSRAALRA